MKYFFHDEQTNFKQIINLLKPSDLSSLIDFLVTLAVLSIGVIATRLPGSTLQQAIFTVQNSSASSYQQLTSKFANNTLISNLPLLIFWLAVGFIVYYFAISTYNAFHDVVELEQEMGYVNAQRQKLLLQALLHLVVRVVAVVIWFVFISLYIKKLIPYALSMAHRFGLSYSLVNFKSLLLAALLLLLGSHLHTIFLRLVLLRQRVFGS